MCYQGKCLMCFPVKKGCLVLAILFTIWTAMALLLSVIHGVTFYRLTKSGVLFATGTSFLPSVLPGGNPFIQFLEGLAGTAILITGLFLLMAFIFCVLLCNGICQRRPGQVMAYFIYGVTMMVLRVLRALFYVIVNPFPPGLGIVMLLFCAIDSLFLGLVHQTYFILLEEAARKDIPHPATQTQKLCA